MDAEELFGEKDRINKALEEFFPRKISKGWLEKNFGKASWAYDVEAAQRAIADPIWNFLDRGGKRWRPLLMMLCCEAVGGDSRKALKYAAIPEFIHNGTLIIDDIEDNSDLRRGEPALHRQFGIDVAVNAGNTMYYLPFLLISNSGMPDSEKRRMYDVITIDCLRCHLGQGTDIFWHNGNKDDISEEEYLQMCANKTGVLARISAKLGGILGGASDEQVEALGRFGEALGVVFQIQDDILNMTDTEGLGKQFGDDISEGKRTLLVLHAVKAAPAAEKRRLLSILEMHTKDTGLIQEAKGIIERQNSPSYARSIGRKIMRDAWLGLDSKLPGNQAKSRLKLLSEHLAGE